MRCEITSVYAALRDLHMVPGLRQPTQIAPNRDETANKPPINFCAPYYTAKDGAH
jgi:hypothetical protein